MIDNESAVIKLENISHGYAESVVLSNLSYNFTENKITAILGRSGSGKTTLLRIINGMIKPTSGLITLFGEPCHYEAIHTLRLKIGYVIQHVGLFPHLSIQENIGVLARIVKMEKKWVASRIHYLMDLVQLPVAYLTKYPHQLSGGEQQRVGLCRAMFLNPPVLLMDEPFASLDNETKELIYQHLISIQQQEPRTVVLVTHNETEALTLADHFIWLKEGKLASSGNRENLRERLTLKADS